jgi:hypothetical protein
VRRGRLPEIGIFALQPSGRFVDAKTRAWIQLLKARILPNASLAAGRRRCAPARLAGFGYHAIPTTMLPR